MDNESYKKLCEEMTRRGGRYPGKDIPEFYDLVKELFTPDEAAVVAAMTAKPATAAMIAQKLGKEKEITPVLEAIASKALCVSFPKDGIRYYVGVPFVPEILEFQFMRGTRTERDRRLARLIHNYKRSFDETTGPVTIKFPPNRVIPIGETIRPESKIHTYNQISSYVDRQDVIAVVTCFCRHEAKLLDEKDDCGMPDEVCMQFGMGAQFLMDQGMGRKVTKEEAKEVLRKAAEAGLVHAGLNSQHLDFICNCCSCHCMILKDTLSQPKPGRVLYSGYQPSIDPDLCTGCETCIGRCPAKALTLPGDVPIIDLDRCFGCGVCAVGCPVNAIEMVEKEEIPIPPVNRKELEKIMGSRI